MSTVQVPEFRNARKPIAYQTIAQTSMLFGCATPLRFDQSPYASKAYVLAKYTMGLCVGVVESASTRLSRPKRDGLLFSPNTDLVDVIGIATTDAPSPYHSRLRVPIVRDQTTL